MRRRIRCLWHKEQTASLVQYKDGWRCFGACHKLYTNKEVEERTGEHYEYEGEDDDKEEIEETFKYINSLPKREERGLLLHSDDRGYYVVWPDDAYYKYRVRNPGKGPKYIGPKGHRPLVFWARRLRARRLAIVEGEISAMSLALAFPEWDVCSPGSASMFNADSLSKLLTDVKKYDSVLVVLDDDSAGLKALIEAKAFLLYKIPFLSFIQMKPDANDVLQEKGTEGVRQAVLGAHPR